MRKEMGLTQKELSFKLGVSFELARAYEVKIDSTRHRFMSSEVYYRFIDLHKTWKKKNGTGPEGTV